MKSLSVTAEKRKERKILILYHESCREEGMPSLLLVVLKGARFGSIRLTFALYGGLAFEERVVVVIVAFMGGIVTCLCLSFCTYHLLLRSRVIIFFGIIITKVLLGQL